MTPDAALRRLVEAAERMLRDFMDLAEQAGHLGRQCRSCRETLDVMRDALAAAQAAQPASPGAHDLCAELDEALHGRVVARPYSPAHRWVELLDEIRGRRTAANRCPCLHDPHCGCPSASPGAEVVARVAKAIFDHSWRSPVLSAPHTICRNLNASELDDLARAILTALQPPRRD